MHKIFLLAALSNTFLEKAVNFVVLFKAFVRFRRVVVLNRAKGQQLPVKRIVSAVVFSKILN